MSRSKHTDPKAIRAARRVNAPRDGRGVGDLGQRRMLRQESKGIGHTASAIGRRTNGPLLLRFIVQKPSAGFHHPAGKQDILKILEAIGPMAFYGLRSVELSHPPVQAPGLAPLFGRYCAPGRIILFTQPLPPWRLSGRLQGRVGRRLERAGAVLTILPDVGATLVDWPQETLRKFVLEEVLLHELGHHVLQHYKGKRSARIARTRDHEAFAARFALKQRIALKKRGRH